MPDPAPLQPTTTEVYGVPVPERIVAVRAGDATTATVAWTLRDPAGQPVDLTDHADHPARLRLGEALGGGGVTEVVATIADAVAGRLTATVDTPSLGGPGVYAAEIAVLTDAADPAAARTLWANRFFVTVERSLFGAEAATAAGPPTIAEIRLHLRDSSPAEHRLIETVTFDDAEIAACIARPVQYFDEELPPLEIHFTTQTFPFRYHWLEGIKASLFAIAAEYYRKNHLRYQAAGVVADDLDKANDYDKKAADLWATYRDWVHRTKIKLNVEAAYGTCFSPYASTAGYYANLPRSW